MPLWKLAAVQMDCRLGETAHNLGVIRSRLAEAANLGAQVVLFPECALTGYGFESRDEALPFAEPLLGGSLSRLADDCAKLGVWTICGFLERGERGVLFNAAALVGPRGPVAAYRKIHLPCLGVDRFTTPGDRPFAVHDLGGLRVGMTICYDAGFPEATRVLALLGADLVVLPTNWPPGAKRTMRYLVQARALENHIYYAAANRIGEERGFRFIGHSRIIDCNGDLLAASEDDQPALLIADIDPAVARAKRIVHLPGKYEIDRINDRRPEMYGPLTDTRKGTPVPNE